MADRRDVAGRLGALFQNIDTQRMRATVYLPCDDADCDHCGGSGDDCDQAHDVRIEFEVCGTCDGRGTHVNPSIDSHGLSREDFDADPDFRDDYFAGRYDVACAECKGDRVVPALDEAATDKALVARIQAVELERWQAARDDERDARMGY